METRNKVTEEKLQQESNPAVTSSTSWFWDPFSYLWGNSTQPTEVQQASGSISPNANAQEAHLLPQQSLTEQQQAVRLTEEQKQPEEALAQQETKLKTQQETVETSSSNMCNLFSLSGSPGSAAPTEIAPESPSAINTFNEPILADNSYVSYVFRPITPFPADDPHPGQAFASQTTAESALQSTVVETAEPEEILTEAEEERDRLRGEQEALTVAIRLQQEQVQQTILLQREQEQQRAEVQAAEEERDRLRREQEARAVAIRLQQEQAQQAMLLQQRAEVQAAEERRKAEEAFSRSCATGARTLEEHYRIARAEVMRAGF